MVREGSRDSRGRGTVLPFAEALSGIPGLDTQADRDAFVDVLRDELDEPMVLKEQTHPRMQLYRIAEFCARTPERLDALLRAARWCAHDPARVSALERLVLGSDVEPVHTSAATTTLLALLEGTSLPDLAELCASIAGPAADDLRGPVTYRQAFALLDNVNTGASGLPRTLELVERIATRFPAGLGNELRDWAFRQALELEVVDQLLALRGAAHTTAGPAPGSPAYLVLRLERHGPSGEEYRLWDWRQLDGTADWAPVPGREVTGPLPVVKKHVADLVDQVEREWARHDVEIRIEVFLSPELLNLDVDAWPWERGALLDEPVGCRYQLVVRSTRRAVNPRYLRVWFKRWSALLRHLAEGRVIPLSGRVDCEAGALTALMTELNRDRELVAVVLSGPPEPGSPGFQQVEAGERHGVPLMLWHRDRTAAPGFPDLVDALLHTDDDRHDLLGKVRLMRVAAFGAETGTPPKAGAAVTVLYDDPDRLVTPSGAGVPEEAVAP
ncbi:MULTISPECIES: hypothetical protein [Actinosynnema]|uniref:VMAP-C domain-containing protein n=1 Tax=Actinosynnema TaxID=40566 RepID=UPI0020A60424|nr:hypothetical protein [Actinosynnema pretiosum]MCP2094663.1 hypothetical protein [Actinosynnema pretiosum]